MPAWRALVAAVLVGIATMTPARAETVYAYWSYWQGDSGAWRYATTGPATAAAVDGAVDGWRFTLGSDGRAAQPAPEPDFSAVCGDAEKPAGSVRVAILIDFGAASDRAPIADCAVVASGLSRASALGAVAALRLHNGFICGINGIPETGCGDAVAGSSPSAGASGTPEPVTAIRPSSTATATAGTPKPTPVAPGASPLATAAPTMPAAPELTSPSPSATAAQTGADTDGGSPIATVITFLLAGVVMALALRNAQRQRAQR